MEFKRLVWHWNTEIVRRLSKACTQQKNEEPWLRLAPAPRNCRIGLKKFWWFLNVMVINFDFYKYRLSNRKVCQTWLEFYKHLCEPKILPTILNSLKLSLNFSPNHSKTIMNGDFIALSYCNFNSSSKFKWNDARIKPITQHKKKQILDCNRLCWFRTRKSFCDHTPYGKKHKRFTRLDDVFWLSKKQVCPTKKDLINCVGIVFSWFRMGLIMLKFLAITETKVESKNERNYNSGKVTESQSRVKRLSVIWPIISNLTRVVSFLRESTESGYVVDTLAGNLFGKVAHLSDSLAQNLKW